MSLDRSEAERLLGELIAPWVRDLRLSFETIDAGRVSVRMPFDERLTRIGGTVCGQALMALADTTMVFVVSSAIGEFRPMTTVSQSSNFMRPIAGADVIAEGRILRLGRTMAFGEVFIRAAGSEAPAVHVSSAYALIAEPAKAAAAPPSPH
ncbi:PaaI family thioesterase [Enterovirga sp. CN4-39]|uniref:PaaI family thioesterase n=1 Tax=Enterovirga sp. CN4-39 TaxID=3400910 RepID=UPI003BFE3571